MNDDSRIHSHGCNLKKVSRRSHEAPRSKGSKRRIKVIKIGHGTSILAGSNYNARIVELFWDK